MMELNRKFSYTRESDVREQLEPHKDFAVATKSVSHEETNPTLSRIDGYSKEEGKLSPCLYCVISGGTGRERVFLQELDAKQTFSNVKVHFVSSPKNGGELTPAMMQRKYEQILQENVLHTRHGDMTLADIDRFYMFTDVDHYNWPEFLQVKPR